MAEWIKTSNRLPSKARYYKVKGGVGSPMEAYWNGTTFIIGGEDYGCITHWKEIDNNE